MSAIATVVGGGIGLAAGAAGIGGLTVGAGALGGAAIGAGVGGAYMSSKATGDAAKTAAGEQRAALDYQKEISAPYRALGDQALPQYYQMLGLDAPLDEEGNPLFDVPTGQPELSPLAQWEQQQAFKQQGRAESARGLSGSGGSAAREADITSSIAASDYMNQYSRILDALKIGTGASASAGQAQQTYANNVGDIALQQGQNQGNFWQGLGAAPLDAYNLFQKTQPPQTQAPVLPAPSSTVYSPQGFGVDSSKYSTYF